MCIFTWLDHDDGDCRCTRSHQNHHSMASKGSMANLLSFGLRPGGRSRSQTSSLHEASASRRPSYCKPEVPPQFSVNIEPSSWKREDDKPINWIVENRHAFNRLLTLCAVSGQHAIVDVLVSPGGHIPVDHTSSVQPSFKTRRKMKRPVEEYSPGEMVELAVKQHLKSSLVSYLRFNHSTPPEAIYQKKSSKYPDVLNAGPLYSDVFVVEDLHLASPAVWKTLRNIMTLRRAIHPLHGNAFETPMTEQVCIIAVCSHAPRENSSMLLPLSLRELFFLSMRVDVPLISRKISGDQSRAISTSLYVDGDSVDSKGKGDKVFPKAGEILYRFFDLDIDFEGRADRIRRASSRAKTGRLDLSTVDRKAQDVYVSEPMKMYLRNLLLAHRSHTSVSIGPTGRHLSLPLRHQKNRDGKRFIDPFLESTKLIAYLSGASFVLPWHIRYIMPYVMTHRLEMKNLTGDRFIEAESLSRSFSTKVPTILKTKEEKKLTRQ